MTRSNDTIMQYFQWYLPDDGNLWKNLQDDSQHLADIGITMVWMPPAFKATGTNDVGYGVYDLFDLGEFDQKGSIRTKYGTKDEYLGAIKALESQGIRPIADIVLNHKAHGDEKEAFHVLKMDPNNRQKPISEPYEIDAYTYFTFPGRQGKYNDFKWHWYHFSGIDYDARNNETGVYLILGDDKGWADNEAVDSEKGNFDYLMFNDVDFSHPEVIQNMKDWAKWFIETTHIKGFRLDAVKHIDSQFLGHFIEILTDAIGEEDFYVFGEYWHADYDTKVNYLSHINHQFDLVDVGLHMNLFAASNGGKSYDLRKLFDGTLMKDNPTFAVTFVDNHDTQPGQALQTTVQDWFKPIAYGIILLSEKGLPTVFYGDYYGVEGDFYIPSFQKEIDQQLFLRKRFAYGEQFNYFDQPNCIGWTRQGTEDYPGGLAVILSNGDASEKRMQIATAQAGQVFVDYLGNHDGEVVIEEDGWATFFTSGGNISAWVNKDLI